MSNRITRGGRWYWINNGVTQTVNQVPAILTTCVQQTDDTVTPGYQQLVAAGQVINHPYSSVSREISGGVGGSISVKWQSGATSAILNVEDFAFADAVGGVYSAGATPAILNYQPMVSYAQTKALSGVQSAQMQSLVSLGEFRETLRMLLSPVRGLQSWFQTAQRKYNAELQRQGREALRIAASKRKARMLSRIKAEKAVRKKESRRLMDRVAGFGDDAADMVLAYNLGWKPFLNDIDNLLNKIPSLEYQERRTSRAQREDSESLSVKTDRSTAYGTNVVLTETQSRVKVRANVLYVDSFEASQHFGTRLADLPETVYELIPYSFLLDYVVNVGDYLGALRALMTAKVLAYSTVVEIEATATKSWDSVKSVIAHPGVNNVVGTVQSRDPGQPEVLDYKAKSRSVDSFGPSFAVGRPGGERPPAQLQNVLGLLIKQLSSLR